MERHDMMQEWLAKALHKIDTMPRDEFIVALENAGVKVEPEENIDETTKAD